MSDELSNGEVIKRILTHHGIDSGNSIVFHVPDRVNPEVEWCRIPDVPGIICPENTKCYESQKGSNVKVYPLWTNEQKEAADRDIFREVGVSKTLREEYDAALLVRKSQYPEWDTLFLDSPDASRYVTVTLLEKYSVSKDTEPPALFKKDAIGTTKKKKITSNRVCTSLKDATTQEEYCKWIHRSYCKKVKRDPCPHDIFMSKWLGVVGRHVWFNAHRESFSPVDE